MWVLLAKSIGLLVAAFGLTLFAMPQFIHKVFDFFKEGKRLYWAGVFRSLVGLVLLLEASQSAVPAATVSLGVLFLLSGIIVFACDAEKLKAFLAQYSEMPVLVLRLLGLVAACFGILIFAVT